MKNSKTKRFIAIMLAVLMVPALTPLSVFADTQGNDTGTGIITWVNPHNPPGSKILEVDYDVPNGTEPEYNGSDPVRNHPTKTYIFIGWHPDLEGFTVNGNQTFTAQFDEVKTYTVKWYNLNESIFPIETDTKVLEGTLPEYNGDIPTKDATNCEKYEFYRWEDKWGNPIHEVSGNTKYYAKFRVSEQKVIWRHWDGSGWTYDDVQWVPVGDAHVYGGEPLGPYYDGGTKYVFDRWSGPATSLCGCKLYTAVFNMEFKITWRDYDESLLGETWVAMGDTPTFPDPTKPDYQDGNGDWWRCTFDDWYWNPTGIISGVIPAISPWTYYARYSCERLYKIKWVNDIGILNDDSDNELLRTDLLELGEMPLYGMTPTRPATAQYTYSFDGWDPVVVPVAEDEVYIARYIATVNTYTVTWENWNGSNLETDGSVPYGDMPEYNGDTPTRPATAQYTYTFTGWTPATSMVTGDVTYTAEFDEVLRTYPVTWENWNGTVLETDGAVPYGTLPVFNGDTPTRPASAQFSYVFAGWTPIVEPVTGAVTYTAAYNAVTNAYTVVWEDWDGEVLETDLGVLFGAIPSYDGDEPTREDTDELTYSFTGWTPTVSAVTGNITYTAEYAEEAIVVPVEPAPTDTVEPDDAPKESLPEWALVNLLCAIFTVIMLAVLMASDKKKKEFIAGTTEKKTRGRFRIGAIVEIVVAIAAVITFILTENMNNPMTWTDEWTVLMVIFAVASLATFLVVGKRDDENEGAPVEA